MHESAVVPSRRLGAVPLFEAAGKAYTVDDAIRWATPLGLLAAALREVAELLAAEESDTDVNEDDLQAASERFRYERDLITAGETEEWLSARGMTVDDFSRWLSASLLRGAGGVPADTDQGDAGEFLRIHLWLSGEIERLSRDYSRSVAAALETGGRDDAGSIVRGNAVSDSARQRKLSILGMALVRVELESLVVDSEAAAREAVLCVRSDRQPLAAVAADAGFRSETIEAWLEDFDVAIRGAILGATAGDAIGPFKDDGKFTVFQLLRRKEPALTSAEVVERIDAMLVDEAFDDLSARHIRPIDPNRTP